MLASHVRIAADGSSSFLADRRLALAASVGGGFVLIYVAATALGAPSALLSHVFNLPMGFAFVTAWWAFLRAPREIRPIWGLLAAASTCWGIGSVGWTIEFEENGRRVPTPPTPWDVPFALALVLTVVAVVIAIRGSIRLGNAALDAVAVVCGTVAVGAAFAERGLGEGFALRTVAALDRPVVGLVTLGLIVSAALGHPTAFAARRCCSGSARSS